MYDAKGVNRRVYAAYGAGEPDSAQQAADTEDDQYDAEALSIIHICNVEEVERAIDVLATQPVVIETGNADVTRIYDFLSGAARAIGGGIAMLSKTAFIAYPAACGVSLHERGSYRDAADALNESAK